MKSISIVVMILSSLVTPAILAQQNSPYGAKGPSKVEFEGKLQAWQAGMMRIVSSDGKPIVFGLPQSSNGIRFTVPVDRSALKPGMTVRIQAPVSGNGQFLEPIGAMTIFVPDRSKISERSSIAERSLNVPGIYPLKMIYPTSPGATPSPDVRIVGTIASIDQNFLAMQCGSGPMKIELSENAKIELTMSSLDYAKPGDSVKGVAAMNPATNQPVALSVTITGVKPLMGTPSTPQFEAPQLRIKEKSKSKLKKPETKDEPKMTETPESTEPPETTDKPAEQAASPEKIEAKIEN